MLHTLKDLLERLRLMDERIGRRAGKKRKNNAESRVLAPPWPPSSCTALGSAPPRAPGPARTVSAHRFRISRIVRRSADSLTDREVCTSAFATRSCRARISAFKAAMVAAASDFDSTEAAAGGRIAPVVGRVGAGGIDLTGGGEVAADGGGGTGAGAGGGGTASGGGGAGARGRTPGAEELPCGCEDLTKVLKSNGFGSLGAGSTD
jgi:hypothetical protein